MAEQDIPGGQSEDEIGRLSVPDKLRYLRDSFSDEIPEEVVHSTSPNKKFKVRKGWFQGVTATLERALDEGFVANHDIELQVKDFVEEYLSQDFKDKPLTEASDIFEANKIINLVLGEEHVLDIDQLAKVQEENIRHAAEFRESITRTFDSPSYRRSIGIMLFGEEKKKTVGPNGETVEEDWTQEDFDRESDRMDEEQELSCRDTMARGLRLAIESQMEFFSSTEHPLLQTSNTSIDLILAMTERFLASEVPLFEDWPSRITKEREQSEALEEVRQMILKPVTTLYEHIEVNDDVWELQTPDMRAVAGDREKWRVLEWKRIKQGLKDRDEQEWIEILSRLDEHLTYYLKELTLKAVRDRRSTIDFGSRLARGGEKIVPQHHIQQMQTEADDLEVFSLEFVHAPNLIEALESIRKKYGQDADFRSFLQKLNWMEKLLEQETQTGSDSQQTTS